MWLFGYLCYFYYLKVWKGGFATNGELNWKQHQIKQSIQE